jgi:MoaA/NifB/PqqE/SkfB family radical SAM enzyme
MSDMSNLPAADAVNPASDDDQNACIDFIVMAVDRLADGLDDPDIWQILADMAGEDHVPLLLACIADLRPKQVERPVVKALDLLSGVLIATGLDHATGMAALKQLEAEHSLCPQVAGACFFAERYANPDKSADLSTKFCESPFIKFETLIDGTVAPCCSIWTKKRLGHLERQNFDEIWNSVDAIEMRESILDGSFRYCNKQRCTLIMEDALPERDAVTDPELRTIIDEGRTVLDSAPRWLFLAHDITCNLSCPSCRDKLIASDEAEEARFAKIEDQVFFPLLNAEGEVTISVSGQGDPWSSQHYRSILRYMADHDLNAQLNIHTNALLMAEKRWQGYLGLEKYTPLVDVSIDAATPWVYEIVRRPGKWEKLEPNLRFIASKRADGVFREFHINATIQLDNFHEMPALVDFAEDLGTDTVRFYMMQNTGAHIARTYARNNIGDNAHPLHLAFLETLRDPKLGRAIVHLYDVATWRSIAFESRLPSDALGTDYSADDLHAAIENAISQETFDVVAALCAAGRIRFPDDLDLLRVEARALTLLGYPQQAAYRDKMLAARQEEKAAAVAC